MISVTDKLGEKWLSAAGKDMSALQKQLDKGEPIPGFALEGIKLSCAIDIEPVTSRGRNVLAILPATEPTKLPPTDPHYQPPDLVIVGAHIDHLGTVLAEAHLRKKMKLAACIAAPMIMHRVWLACWKWHSTWPPKLRLAV